MFDKDPTQSSALSWKKKTFSFTYLNELTHHPSSVVELLSA